MFARQPVFVPGAVNNGQQQAPNAGMSAGRIDIEGQMGVCDRGGVKVSRAQPAVLSGLITDEQWERDFCDRIDAALKPIEHVKDLNLAFMAISCILLLALFIGGMVLIAQVSTWSTSNTEEGFWIFMLVSMAFVFIGGIALTLYGKNQAFTVRSAMRRVCDDVSNDNPNVSFHVKFEAYTLFRGRDANTLVVNYIEVSIKNADPEAGGPQVVVNVNVPGATAAAAVSEEQQEQKEVTAVPVVKGTAIPEQAMRNEEEEVEVDAEGTAAIPAKEEKKKTATERLAQLEALKDLLTDEEYNEKRKEILASV